MVVFSVFLKNNLQTQFSLLFSAVAVYRQVMTILRKVLILCNYRLYVNWHIFALSAVAIRISTAFQSKYFFCLYVWNENIFCYNTISLLEWTQLEIRFEESNMSVSFSLAKREGLKEKTKKEKSSSASLSRSELFFVSLSSLCIRLKEDWKAVSNPSSVWMVILLHLKVIGYEVFSLHFFFMTAKNP